ncbi:MAG: hypothetical protein IKO76_05055 [Butyrivibrio sp.]|nr:hypothetical protein [Butyrivibrio sp.]
MIILIRYVNIIFKEITRAEDKNNKKHLIDDTGIHEDYKPKQITLFVTMCRIVTVILIILGLAALIVEY